MKFNPNFGAFDKEDKLQAWCFQYQSGSLTGLQVLDDGKKRRGLGSIMVKTMSKKLAEKQYDTFGCIVDGNDASLKLFKKLGFECIDQVYWIGIEPKPEQNINLIDLKE